MLSKTLPPIVLLAFVGLALFILRSSPEATQGKKPEKAAMIVDTKIVRPQQFVPSIPSYGKVRPYMEYAIYSQVSGQVIERSPLFQAGAFIAEGDVLLKLDDAEYQAALVTARANLAQAELALEEEQARAEQARNDWQKQGQKNARAFVLREPHVKAAKAKVAQAISEVKLAERNLSHTVIRSKFNARITEVLVQEGAQISPAVALAAAYASEFAEVALPIASKDLAWLDTGFAYASSDAGVARPIVEIINPLDPDGAAWEGIFSRTSAALDEQTQQLNMLIKIAAPFAPQPSFRLPLVIGQYVEADIKGAAIEAAIVIENSYIYQGPYVYIVEDEALQRRPIRILRQEQDRSVVGEGLSFGDRLVTTLLGNITSGTQVRIREEGSSDAAGADLSADMDKGVSTL